MILAFAVQVAAQEYDFQQNADDLVVMEAENFTENRFNGFVEWLPSAEPDSFSGEGAMLAVTDSPFASAEDALAGSAVLIYAVNFTQTGPHYVWARASRTADNPGGTDSYHVGLNGAIPATGTFINFENAFGGTEGSWQWIMWSGGAGDQASLDIPSAGVHDVEVYIRENNFRIDKIVLTPVPYGEGTGYGPPPDSIPETLASTGMIPAGVDADAFSFFPNPAGDQIHIWFKAGAASENQLGIFDITGKQIRTMTVGNVASLDVDVSKLHTGIYYLKLERRGEIVSVQKMLKL